MKVFVNLEVREVNELYQKSLDETKRNVTELFTSLVADELKPIAPKFVEYVILWPVERVVTSLLRSIYSTELSEAKDQQISISPIDENDSLVKMLASLKEYLQDLGTDNDEGYMLLSSLCDMPTHSELCKYLDGDLVDLIYGSIETTIQEIRDRVYAEISKRVADIHIQLFPLRGVK